MAQAGQVFVNFGANTQGLLAGTARAGNILQRFSQTGVGAAIVMGAAFVTLSRVMTGFATNAVGGFKDFNFHIVRAKALSGATTEEFKAMSDTAEELGRTTEFMAKDVAAGMSNLALAGFKANEIIKMIPDSLRLATAGNVGLAKTNTIMANAMRGFTLESTQANRVSNVLTATFTTTNTTLEGLAQTLKNAVGVLATLGVEIEEVAAAAGVLGDVGINASVAGTGLKNFGIKLAKTFGIMKDGAKSAKEFFESLGVTKEKLFDAETGTLNMVAATMSFKEALDKLGKSRAPEFLAQFSKLFGARAATSLAALVRNAEKYKIQVENTRMTGMIGDVQKVFEEMQNLSGEGTFTEEIYNGLGDAIKDMAGELDDANLYMEEFRQGGEGAAGAINRLAKSFRDTQKILISVFGEDSFEKTKDGLIKINEYSKDNAVDMVKLGKVIDELAKKNIGIQRRRALEEEKIALEAMVVSGEKTIEQLTEEGRGRLLNLGALEKHVSALKAGTDGMSKSANQLSVLNQVFQGNSKSVAMAAQAFGIQIKAGEKLGPGLEAVQHEMTKLTFSTESQSFAMKRLMSQTATTNTAMNMQRIQLQTLDGTIKIFRSGIERAANGLAKALSPAIDASIKSMTEFLKAMTLSNDEIRNGVTAQDKLEDAWNKTLKIFTEGGGIFQSMKETFKGLSSIGKTVASVVGILGAAGITAGGAFIWIQALGPALIALSGTFFTLVAPIAAVIAVAVALGLHFKRARDSIKKFGEGAKDELDPLVEVWIDFKEQIKGIGKFYDSLIEKIQGVVEITERLGVVGGEVTFFKTKEDLVTITKSVDALEDAMKGLTGVTEEQKEALRTALSVGDAPEFNKLMKEIGLNTGKTADDTLTWGLATAQQRSRFSDLNVLIKESKETMEGIVEERKKLGHLEDLSGAKLAEAEELNAKILKFQTDINDKMEERSQIQSDITEQKATDGKLTKMEIARLTVLRNEVTGHVKFVKQANAEREKLGAIQNRNKQQEKDYRAAIKKSVEEKELLRKKQLEYNGILDASVSKNPFVLMWRVIKQITMSVAFKNFILEVGKITVSVLNYIVEVALPKIFSVLEILYTSVKKFLKTIWPSVKNLLSAISSLFGAVFGIIGVILERVFGIMREKGKGAATSLSEVIDRVAKGIDNFAERIKELPIDRILEIARNFGILLLKILGFVFAFKIIGAIFKRLDKLGAAATRIGTTFKNLGLGKIFGPMLTQGMSIKGILVVIGQSFVTIAAIATVLIALFIAFKENMSGIRDVAMEFIKIVVTKVAEIWEQLVEMFSSLFGLMMSVAKFLAPILAWILAFLGKILNRALDIVLSIVASAIQMISGIFKFLDGLFSGNKQKMIMGLLDIGEALLQMVIKLVGLIVSMVTTLGTWILKGLIYGVEFLLRMILQGLKFILPKPLEKFLKLDEATEAIKGFGEKTRGFFDQDKNADTIKDIEKMLGNQVTKLYDKNREAVTGKSKAQREVDKQEEKKKKVEEKAARKAAANVKAQSFAKMGVDQQTEEQKKTNEKIDGLKDKLDRPNVTNNTNVEYKAAEDDEVNRRMIERIMNDVLKAGVGMDMGDTASING